MNLTEVSRSLGSPKTTVQANLCRLEEEEEEGIHYPVKVTRL